MTRILLSALAATSLTACGTVTYESETKATLDTRIRGESSPNRDSLSQWPPTPAASQPVSLNTAYPYDDPRCIRVAGHGCVNPETGAFVRP